MLVDYLSKLFLQLVFYSKPNIEFSEEEIQEYESIISEPKSFLIRYNSRFPKYRFVQYLSLKENFILHGTNNKNIDEFEPRIQTLFNGKITEAVFASKDGIWPVFYAVLDRTKLEHSIRNGCVQIKTGPKFYFFSLSKDDLRKKPWTSGMIYILPSDCFHKVSNGSIQFDEWICEKPVKPIAKLEVNPRDFYFWTKTSAHKENEHIPTTIIKYKLRNLVGIKKSSLIKIK
ncbi:hypothetical protein [Clostridium folliculivorans]|uniref:Uncharacterized protein n=1 Tax=Clostridium folliculivorans TaxID=2886038 RepID=A0A9W5Y1L5_9CLOT|nr:hypothetical protein [Clostridium folliculivorans]GKU25059.1 hypothetical protein CFOLD11_18850 [Clostridium folliculivorans]GKU31157.1 hypothetical protein CFB3_32640 [Clostridium folliculivorans]